MSQWNFTDQDIDMAKNISLETPNSVAVNYNQSLFDLNGLMKQQIDLLNSQFANDLVPTPLPMQTSLFPLLQALLHSPWISLMHH